MPYFGVIPADEFDPDALDSDAKSAFFASGEEHVSQVFDWVRRYFDEGFQPRRCLDFGCGVGRLVVPLGKKVPEVVGVDISKGMLDEARRNCEAFGLKNVEFVESDDDLSKVTGTFDLIHSFIVLQHMATSSGERVFRRMLHLLNEGGVGFLHFTFAKVEEPFSKKVLAALRQKVPLVNGLINLAKGRDFGYPYIAMNSYDVNRILQILHKNGYERTVVALTQHGNDLGMVLMFQNDVNLDPATFCVEWRSIQNT